MFARGVAASTSVLLLVLVLLSFPYVLSKLRGASGEVLSQVKETEPEGLALRVGGSEVQLVSTHHQYQRLALDGQNESQNREELIVTGTLDFTGRWGNVRVSSLGLEEVGFKSMDGEWHPVRGYAPRLVSIVEALETRRKALESFDREVLQSLSAERLPVESARWSDFGALSGRKYQVLAWYIRSERKFAEVREEYRLEATHPNRPVDEKGERLLRLQMSEGRWLLDSAFP